MSKTAEQVALEWVDGHRDDFRGLHVGREIVEALRAAGWIRESADGVGEYTRIRRERDAAQAELELTRGSQSKYESRLSALERDLAAAREPRVCEGCRSLSAELVSKRRRIEWLENANDAIERQCAVAEKGRAIAKSREASPAMLRVVEAAREWLKFYRTNALVWADEKELAAAIAAVDALAAPAVEKPRYYVSGNEVRERLAAPENHRTCAAFYGPGRAARAEAECARLNAEAAR